MADMTVSQMTQVPYKPTLLVPAVDMTAGAGLKNVAIPLSAVIAQTNTAVGVDFTAAGAGALARTVGSRLGDVVSVADFGADPTGVTSSFAAFQAAINATSNAGVQKIRVPRGSYAGQVSGTGSAFTALVLGARAVVWEEEGGVTYTSGGLGTWPPGMRAFGASPQFDASRPYFVGGFGASPATTSGTASDIPTFLLWREAAHVGGAEAVNHVFINHKVGGGNCFNAQTSLAAAAAAMTLSFPSATPVPAPGSAIAGVGLAAGTTVSSAAVAGGYLVVTLSAATALAIPAGAYFGFGTAGAANTEVSFQIQHNNYQSGGPDALVAQNLFARWMPGTPVWAGVGNLVFWDRTGRGAAVAGDMTMGEIDLAASGSDPSFQRSILRLTYTDAGPSIDGQATLGYGVALTGRWLGNPSNNTYFPGGVDVLGTVGFGVLGTTYGGPTGNGTAMQWGTSFVADSGSVAAFQVNGGRTSYPTTADSPLGSAILVLAATAGGIVRGQAVSGTGIAAGALVASVSWTAATATVTLTTANTADCPLGSVIAFQNQVGAAFQTVGTSAEAFDCASATLSGNALNLAVGQTIGVGTATALSFAAGSGLTYSVSVPATPAVLTITSGENTNGALPAQIIFGGENAASAPVGFVTDAMTIVSNVAGSETGQRIISAVHLGVVATEMTIGQGIGLGIGVPKGNGSLNLDGALYYAGTQVVKARQTGWGTPSGTLSRATFATGTVTTAVVAETLGALITDLISHGLIGA